MARGTTLGQLVTKLRVELKQSTASAVGVDMVDNWKETLRSVQEWLYDEYDWRQFRYRGDTAISAGSRYYDLPANLEIEGIWRVEVKYNSQWLPVEQGIDMEHYDAFDSDADERNDPITLWDIIDTGSGPQMEVWPVPATATTLRITGKKNLSPLVSEADTADLDDRLIVLFAASRLARDADAQRKLFDLGNQRFMTLKGRQASSRRTIPGEGSGPYHGRRQGATIRVTSSGSA